MVYSMLLPLMMMLTAGGQASDLLDLMPTQSYWQTKHVAVATDAMLQEVSATAADDDVPGGVRRLMAIRTLGELKDAKALPALKGLLDSKRQFEADYAQEAMNAINGKPTIRPVLDAAVRKQDLALLPAQNTMIGQLSRRGEHATVDALLQASFADDKERQDAADAIAEAILPIAEKIGNARIDGASVGAAMDVTPMTVTTKRSDASGAVAIIHGSYNAKLVRGLFPKDKMTDVGGVPAYSDNNTTIIAAADDRLVIVGGEPFDEAFIQKLVANLNKPATPKQLDDLTAQQTGVDTTKALWVRMVVPAAMAQNHAPPAIAHTKDFILTSDYTADGANLQLVANCDTAENARALMGLIRVGIGQIKVAMLGQIQRDPTQAKAFEAFQTFLANVKMDTKDNSLIVSDVFTPDLLNLPLSQAIKSMQMMKHYQKMVEQRKAQNQPATQPAH